MSPNWLRTFMLAVSSHLLAATLHAQAMRVTLLGTGSPPPSIERFGPATLVEVGGQKLLFDVGRGATQRLWQLGIPLGQVNRVFITHLHSDHVVGLPDLWLTGWLRSAYGQRKAPLQVWGPRGTAGMAAALRQAYAEDIRIRRTMFDYPDSVISLVGHDVGDGTVYDRDGVRVTAFAVEHGSVKPAFGYRLDFGGHSIVISGDTRRSENVVRAARGADVLIHEVTVADPEFLEQSPDARRVVAELHFAGGCGGRVRCCPTEALRLHTRAGLRVRETARGADGKDRRSDARGLRRSRRTGRGPTDDRCRRYDYNDSAPAPLTRAQPHFGLTIVAAGKR